MRERGHYQLQLLKTRSSSGVGSKITLSFDRDSLKIEDDVDGHDDGDGQQISSALNIMDTLKKKTVVNEETKEKQEKTDAHRI